MNISAAIDTDVRASGLPSSVTAGDTACAASAPSTNWRSRDRANRPAGNSARAITRRGYASEQIAEADAGGERHGSHVDGCDFDCECAHERPVGGHLDLLEVPTQNRGQHGSDQDCRSRDAEPHGCRGPCDVRAVTSRTNRATPAMTPVTLGRSSESALRRRLTTAGIPRRNGIVSTGPTVKSMKEFHASGSTPTGRCLLRAGASADGSGHFGLARQCSSTPSSLSTELIQVIGDDSVTLARGQVVQGLEGSRHMCHLRAGHDEHGHRNQA